MVTLASRFYRLQYRSVQLYDQYTYTGHATADVRSAERIVCCGYTPENG